MRRAWLYVPGSSAERFVKAERSGARAVLLDLEDAVALSVKDVARRAVADWLAATAPLAGAARTTEMWVRVNNEAELRVADLDAVVPSGVTGICLAKADSASVAATDARLCALEERSGLARGSVALMPLIESAAGLAQVFEVAAHSRVSSLQLGEGDLAADLNVEVGPGEQELLLARSQVVLASAATGLRPPVAPVSIELHDLDALAASSRQLRRLGFGSRAAIHPRQLTVIDECFSPTAAELEAATALLANFDAHASSGTGAFVGSDGRMVDEAMVRSARRTVDGAP